MNAAVVPLLKDAKVWLQAQPIAEPYSASWYALGNVRSFVSSLEAATSAAEIDNAVFALSRFLSDARQISKGLSNG